jgi:hypothetical protein
MFELYLSIWTVVLTFGVGLLRFGSIQSTLVISSAISAQSVTDILPSTSASLFHPLVKKFDINMNLMDRWMQKLYWNNDAFKDSTNFEHIKTHYYWSQIIVSSIHSLFCWPSMVYWHLRPRSTPQKSSLSDLFQTSGHFRKELTVGVEHLKG